MSFLNCKNLKVRGIRSQNPAGLRCLLPEISTPIAIKPF